MTPALRWPVPGGVLFLLALLLKLGLGPDGLVQSLVIGYPWVVYGGALFLAVFFHRSRVVVALLAIALTAWVGESRAGGFTALFFAGGALALALGASALLRDRGLLTTSGLIQLGTLATVALFGALFLAVAPEDMASLLAAMPLPAWLTLWSGFPQPVFVAFAFALPATLAAALLRGGPVERGAFWALVMSAVGLYLAADPPMLALFLMAGGLTLGLSVVEISYAMAYKDDLTGLPARRALMRDMEGLGGVYTVAMVDVDHFKKFNDRHGHDVGDQVLRMVAVRLAKIDGGGRAYRYGGEEFTLLFPGKAREEALPHLEAVRETVSRATFTLRHWRRPRKKPVDPGSWKFDDARKPKRLAVTVSVGVADSAGADSDPEAVLKKADRALYRAKKGGRNRVSK
jgi:GGDEF domain-containing protein